MDQNTKYVKQQQLNRLFIKIKLKTTHGFTISPSKLPSATTQFVNWVALT